MDRLTRALTGNRTEPPGAKPRRETGVAERYASRITRALEANRAEPLGENPWLPET